MIDEVVPASQTVDAVCETITAIRRQDPFVPILVWGQSGEAARSLSRLVAQRMAMFDVSFVQTRHLAERLLMQAGQSIDKTSLDAALAGELVRKVAFDARGPLKDAVTPSLVAELGKAFRELRSATDIDLEALEDNGPLASEILRLYRQYVLQASGTFDRADLIAKALESIGESGAQVVRVVADQDGLPGDQLEESLAAGLYQAGRLNLLRTENDIGRAFDDHSKVRVYIDPAAEAQGIVEQLLEWADEGHSFGSMTVVHANQEAYGAELELALDEAGIAWRSRSSRSVAGAVLPGFIGRVVRQVSGVQEVNGLLELIDSAPLLQDLESRVPVPVNHWINCVRRTRIGSDPTELIERLEASDEAAAAKFFERLSTDLRPRCDSWGAWCTWLEAFVDSYFDFSALGEEHAVAQTQQMQKVLNNLRRLDVVGLPPDAEWFAAAVLEQLQAVSARRSPGSSVLVSGFSDAVGLVGENVIVCGLAGDTSQASNPIVDAIRLLGEDTARQKEEATVRHLVSSSVRKTLTYARVDTMRAREVPPSPVLVDVASTWAGRPLAVSDLAFDTSLPWLQSVPSFTAGIWHSPMSPSRRIDRLRALGQDPLDADLVELAQLKSQTVRAVRGRQSSELTAFDGLAGPTALPERTSATRLELYARCPRRYFFSSVLRVGNQEEEPDLWAMSALDKGRLVHGVLERFVSENSSEVSGGRPWPESSRQRLRELLVDAISEARTDGRLPGGLLAQWQTEDLLNQLTSTLDADNSMREPLKLGPLAGGMEVGFGASSESEPVRVDVDENSSIAFEGRIDRIDANPDRSLVRAIDYKTGSVKDVSTTDVVDGGRQLQPAVYAAWLAREYPDAQVQSGLWGLKDADSSKAWVSYQWDDANRERFETAVRTVASGVRDGAFPAVPGDDDYLDPSVHTNCKTCPFDSICPVDRGDAWVRKSGDRSVAHLHQLKEAPNGE